METVKPLRGEILKLYSLQPSEVVKVAGVIGKVTKFLKSIFNPEYRAQIKELDANSKELRQSAKVLEEVLNKLQESIENGNLADYEIYFESLKSIAIKFVEKFNLIESQGKVVREIIRVTEPKNEAVKEEAFQYDLALGPQSTPFKSTEAFANYSIDDINISPDTEDFFLKKLNAYRKILPVKIESSDALFDGLKNAIINGTILDVSPKSHAKQFDIMIVTAPFAIPSTQVTFTAKVSLVDLRAQHRGLSYRATMQLKPNRTASRLNRLEKLGLLQLLRPLQVTQLSETELADVLRQGYKQAFGHDPTAEALAGGWAQVVLEAGRPIKLPCNNIGNIKATPDWALSNPYFVKSTNENSATGKKYVDKGAKWRAYATPVEGAVGYWQLLGKRYSDSLDWMAAGDPSSATVSLAKNKYFTANIKQYSHGVESLYNEFMTKIAPNMDGLHSLPAAPSGEKLEVKNWTSEYQSTKPNVESSISSGSGDIDQLIGSLYANGPLTEMVARSRIAELLPTTRCIITIDGKIQAKQKFAKAMDVLIPEVLGGKVTNLGCEVVGMPLTVLAALQGLCDCAAIGCTATVSVMENL